MRANTKQLPDLRFIYTIIIISLLTSCEGFVRLHGKLIDGDSKKEISGAKIELLDLPPIARYDSVTNRFEDSIFISDKNGLFTVQSKMVGMMYGTPKYRVRISKEGYQTLELKITKQTVKELYSPTDSLYLIKLQGE